MKSFIETQFPVSKVSKESFKERTAAQSQTLTQLGKWWGRKPLILVRAAILGLLLPATDYPTKDREIFLKLLTMDDEGMWQRKKSSIASNVLKEYLLPREATEYFVGDKLRSGLSRDDKKELQQRVFLRMGYDERLKYCYRPEEIDGPPPSAWKDINSHLGTDVSSIPELVEQLGIRQFGSRPTVGDCFCGGGSVPFEAARIGCDVFGSDLNPVAALLTWASLNIVGGSKEVVEEVKKVQQEVYDEVDKQIMEWGVENNEKGWRGYAYLYCNEVVCPECGWKVPLLPTFSIAERMQKVIAELEPDYENKRYHIHIRQASPEESENAHESGIMTSDGMVCPNTECPGHKSPIPIATIRQEHEGGLRLWENDDLVPRPNDIFQERLYCIRWMETVTNSAGCEQINWHFCAPDEHDLEHEKQVLLLLKERFSEWQEKGYLPGMKIEGGYNTDQPIRERGWTHWHHLFTSRQLLYHGMLNKTLQTKDTERYIKVSLLIGLNRCNDWDSKLSPWDNSTDKPKNTFYNQALNTLFSYPSRGLRLISNSWFYRIPIVRIKTNKTVYPSEGGILKVSSDYWITDPPYADAINYHELSDFFLAWCNKTLVKLFPDWYTDSKRALAITGSNEEFRKNMVEVYRNLTNHMPDNGAQIVMFTHQDANVWADLATILWAAGLQVTAAWCIATETESGGLKKGNYVQGTVLLVLRKQTSNETAFLDEIYPKVEEEVKKQLNSMLALENKEDPNFDDTDYQLAAYAAALRVITKYKNIEDIDIHRELNKVRQTGEKNPLEEVIENAVKIACDYLVPIGIETHIWKQLTPEEKFYIKGLEIESHGEYRSGAYQELARGFGIREYKSMQESGKANETRLKTASEFKNRNLGDEGFGSSMVRHILFAIRETIQNEETSAGKVWLRTELGQQYWNRRHEIIALLRYLANIGMSSNMEHWKKEAEAARLLAGAVENDHI
jgi:putative DNA methylase